MFTSDDRLLIANENIMIYTHVTTAFSRVIEEVEVHHNYVEHGKFTGNPMRINLLLECEPSSMEYGL